MSLDLVLRRTDSRHVPEWERDQFWNVYCEGYYLGSIVEQSGRSDEARTWRWAMHLHAGGFGNGLKPTSGSAPTRDEAMAAYRAAWNIIRPALTDAGWARHVDHMERLAAQKAWQDRQGAGTEPASNG